jgi:hypothetical protein
MDDDEAYIHREMAYVCTAMGHLNAQLLKEFKRAKNNAPIYYQTLQARFPTAKVHERSGNIPQRRRVIVGSFMFPNVPRRGDLPMFRNST